MIFHHRGPNFIHRRPVSPKNGTLSPLKSVFTHKFDFSRTKSDFHAQIHFFTHKMSFSRANPDSHAQSQKTNVESQINSGLTEWGGS